jgi:Asp/Glu/hydantoin racemase
MRIWHQWSGELDPTSIYQKTLEAHMKAVAGEGVVVDFHGIDPETTKKWVAAVDRDAPSGRHGFNYAWSIHREGLAKGAIRAEAEGYDAFFISMINDAGLEEIRSLVQIPVVGLLQSSLLFGATLGRPIGLVTNVPAAIEQINRAVGNYGLRDLMGPFEVSLCTHAELRDGFTDPTVVIEKFTEAAERAVARGAKVIIPGEAPLNTLMAHAGVSRVAGVPVLDSMGIAIATAEMRSRFFKKSGLRPAEVGFYYATPPQALIDSLKEYYANH